MQETVETQTYAFTDTELEWLTSFKAAVAAGLFSEWVLEPDLGDPTTLETTDASYPSDPRHITRLLMSRHEGSAVLR